VKMASKVRVIIKFKRNRKLNLPPVGH